MGCVYDVKLICSPEQTTGWKELSNNLSLDTELSSVFLFKILSELSCFHCSCYAKPKAPRY